MTNQTRKRNEDGEVPHVFDAYPPANTGFGIDVHQTVRERESGMLTIRDLSLERR